jgi:hypothetical protein
MDLTENQILCDCYFSTSSANFHNQCCHFVMSGILEDVGCRPSTSVHLMEKLHNNAARLSLLLFFQNLSKTSNFFKPQTLPHKAV